MNALEKNDSPKPEFETDEDHSYFISRFFVREGFYDESEISVVENIKTTEKNPEQNKSSGKSSGKTSERIKKMMASNPNVTQEEIARELNISVRAVEKQVKKLREKGQIGREGGHNGGSWTVIGE